MEITLLALAWAQGTYFLITGIWPLVHMPSFLAVTGPKHDLWLVRAVGVLIVAIGGAILLAACQQAVTSPIMLLAIASASGLAGIDVVYVARRVISPIYLADAAVEVVLAALWILAGVAAMPA